ncbi:MAG TPA: TfoX family protein [Nitrospirae bacterium]|nr:hypothetical protein BMS3Abin09_00751 [bacterium BMS3Abin09]GBE40599.1 hypothetical protein BMS3Bbin09_00485 [bacterium BMS3Bbin09]HDH34393.1 TfoX family protein [Nitrospirota bacterium]HDZ84627.1 TfoX family protein [Nitrospirota bacterium]
MKKQSGFIEFLDEVFEEFGPIEVPKMFGGFGVYHDGVMFGLVANDTLYLKTDETTKQHFESRGLPQFEYDRAGKTVKMSYYRAPEEIFDDRDKAALWAQRSYKVAVKQDRRKKSRRPK